MSRIGLDIGATSGGKIVWAVFATTNRYSGMLNGSYVGATAEASIAIGLGANALVGGSNRSIALQPLSVQGQTGFNFGAGIGTDCSRICASPAHAMSLPLDLNGRRLKP